MCHNWLMRKPNLHCCLQSRPGSYRARFCQNLPKTIYFARSRRKIFILLESCKFVPVSYPLIGSRSRDTFNFEEKFPKIKLRVLLGNKKKINSFLIWKFKYKSSIEYYYHKINYYKKFPFFTLS